VEAAENTPSEEPPEAGSDVTLYLEQLRHGDASAVDRLLPHVYAELRRLAARAWSGRTPDRTLHPTALVHEAYLRLFKDDEAKDWENRRHFFSVAAMAMRQLLADSARARAAEKRGGDRVRAEMNSSLHIAAGEEPPVDHLALDRALAKLQALNERQARIVELRYLVGLTLEETAEALDVSVRTVSLDWRMARTWLQREFDSGDAGP
jgi:RNA polymerase sigma factor (TIGR02999 family)